MHFDRKFFPLGGAKFVCPFTWDTVDFSSFMEILEKCSSPTDMDVARRTLRECNGDTLVSLHVALENMFSTAIMVAKHVRRTDLSSLPFVQVINDLASPEEGWVARGEVPKGVQHSSRLLNYANFSTYVYNRALSRGVLKGAPREWLYPRIMHIGHLDMCRDVRKVSVVGGSYSSFIQVRRMDVFVDEDALKVFNAVRFIAGTVDLVTANRLPGFLNILGTHLRLVTSLQDLTGGLSCEDLLVHLGRLWYLAELTHCPTAEGSYMQMTLGTHRPEEYELLLALLFLAVRRRINETTTVQPAGYAGMYRMQAFA